MEEIIMFIPTFIFVYILYQIFIIKKAKRRNSKKRPAEVNFLIYKYNIDIKKLDYKKLLNVIGIVSSLDISIITSAVALTPSLILQLIVAVVIVLPIFFISYYFVGTYYIKKGYVKNE